MSLIRCSHSSLLSGLNCKRKSQPAPKGAEIVVYSRPKMPPSGLVWRVSAPNKSWFLVSLSAILSSALVYDGFEGLQLASNCDYRRRRKSPAGNNTGGRKGTGVGVAWKLGKPFLLCPLYFPRLFSLAFSAFSAYFSRFPVAKSDGYALSI